MMQTQANPRDRRSIRALTTTAPTRRHRFGSTVLLWLLGGACAGLFATPPARAEFVATANDFQCVLNGTQAGGELFRIFHTDPAQLAVAVALVEGGDVSAGFPEGTILQLTPSEAMVKRGGSFNPQGDGWEFFKLRIGLDRRTRIVSRGGAEEMNGAGLSCQTCHANRASDQDLVAGMNTDTPPVTARLWRSLQQGDRRCGP